MRYVLDPDNRNCPDDVLLEDLASVAAQLAKPSITKYEYNEHGRFAAATMQKRFGSWNEALRKAGLDVSPLSPSLASLEDLLSNMAAVWEAVGRQPKQSDLAPPLSKYSRGVYVRRFGSWRAALEHFVNSANSPEQEAPLPPLATQPVAVLSRAQPSTPRDPSWRVRFLVHRRDRFACVACGRSPAAHPGVFLHVDHIVPWSKGGLTLLENLQTLCQTCNIGKSNLPMHAHAG